MKLSNTNPGNCDLASRAEDYRSKLAKLQRREWSIWGTSLTVMFCLIIGLASLSFTAALRDKNVLESIVGLVILVILFGGYSTYEKFLINQLRLEIARNQANSALWRQVALIDPLTGLFNRRYAENRLKEEVLRSQRKSYSLTLVVFDLNNFKQINDRFGHAAGDLVLKIFADSLRNLARESDVAARIGGDEFFLLLTECDADQAQAILGRLKPAPVNLAGHDMPIRFAVGCKQYQSGEQAEDMLKAADVALYEQKRSSKSANLTTAK